MNKIVNTILCLISHDYETIETLSIEDLLDELNKTKTILYRSSWINEPNTFRKKICLRCDCIIDEVALAKSRIIKRDNMTRARQIIAKRRYTKITHNHI